MQAKIEEVSNTIFKQVDAFKQVPVKTKITLPPEPADAMQFIAEMIYDGIEDAKSRGVSPEKIAPLYNALKGVTEVRAELKGTLDRSNKTLILNKIDLNKEIEEYAKAIELSRNDVTEI